jgi:hypothetical protein
MQRSIVLFDGGHRTTIDGLSPVQVMELVGPARQAPDPFVYIQNTAHGDNGLVIDASKVVTVVRDSSADEGPMPIPGGTVRERSMLLQLREAVKEALPNLNSVVDGTLDRLEVALTASGAGSEWPAEPGTAERVRQELDALAILPTERLFREYLHRVIQRTRKAGGKPDAAIVIELLTEFAE